jgi:hypothetical protein
VVESCLIDVAIAQPLPPDDSKRSNDSTPSIFWCGSFILLSARQHVEEKQ